MASVVRQLVDPTDNSILIIPVAGTATTYNKDGVSVDVLLDIITNKFTNDIKDINNSKVYLTEEEYQTLIDENKVNPNVEYNIIEE